MDKVVKIFKALADRNRVRIVAALMEVEELCACQFVELLEVTGATTSRHLSVLQNGGLLTSRKDGRWIYFRLKVEDENLKVIFDWIASELRISKDLSEDRMKLQDIISCEAVDLCKKQRGNDCC